MSERLYRTTNASASDQLAIFDLGESNEFRTEEGITALQAAGTFSADALAHARAKTGDLARSFEEKRDSGASEQAAALIEKAKAAIEEIELPKGVVRRVRRHINWENSELI
jgi:hypothetical protein